MSIAIPSATIGILERIAANRGLFEQHGVTVEIQEETGGEAPNLVASGRADLAIFSIGVPAGLAQQGIDIGMIYSLYGAGISANMLMSTEEGRPQTVEELQALDSCRIVSQGQGTAAYGNAVRLNETLDLGCDVAPLPDPGAQVGSVVAGNAQAVVGTLGNFAEAIDQGELQLVIDTSDPATFEQYFGQNYPLTIVFGADGTLEEKRDAVVAYLRAVDEAASIYTETSTDDLVEQLQDMEGYAAMTPDQIALAIDELRPHFHTASRDGYISPEAWEAAVSALGDFSISNFDASSPALDYDAIIDMSYYEEALGVPE